MEEATEFTKNTRILIIGEIFSFMLSFGFGFFLVRFLSVEEFSIYNLVFVIPQILSYITDFGLYSGCSYFIARLSKLNKNEESRNVIKITLITKSILGIGLAITLYFLSNEIAYSLLRIHNPILIPLLQIGSFLLLSKNLLEGVNSILIGSTKMKIFTIVNIIRYGSMLVITLLLVLLGWNLFSPVIGKVLGNGIAGLLGIIYIQKSLLKHSGKKQSIDWKCLPQLMKRGFSYSFISLIYNVKYEIFILILAIFGFYTGVSYLRVGATISAIFYVILRPVMRSLFPIFSKYSWNNLSERNTLTKIFQFSIKFCNLFISPVILFFIFFASELVPLVFGMNYLVGSQFILVFLVYYLPLTFGMVALPSFFFGQGYSSLAFLIDFFSFSASILIGICFSLFLGSFGFVIGVSLGAFLGLIFGIIITNRKFGKDLFSKKKESFLIVLIAGLLCELFLIGFYIFTLIFVLENPILRLLVLGGVFVCFYGLFLIILVKLRLIKYQEISYFIQEFQNIPLVNKILNFIVKLGKKLWKRNDTS